MTTATANAMISNRDMMIAVQLGGLLALSAVSKFYDIVARLVEFAPGC